MMKCLAELEERIAEELEDACSYITMALEYKAMDMKLADSYYALAKTELEHATLLRNHADRIMEQKHVEHSDMWSWYYDKLQRKKANIMAMIGMYK